MRKSAITLLQELDDANLLDDCTVGYTAHNGGWVVQERGVRYPLKFATFAAMQGYLEGRRQHRMKAMIYRAA